MSSCWDIHVIHTNRLVLILISCHVHFHLDLKAHISPKIQGFFFFSLFLPCPVPWCKNMFLYSTLQEVIKQIIVLQKLIDIKTSKKWWFEFCGKNWGKRLFLKDSEREIPNIDRIWITYVYWQIKVVFEEAILYYFLTEKIRMKNSIKNVCSHEMARLNKSKFWLKWIDL